MYFIGIQIRRRSRFFFSFFGTFFFSSVPARDIYIRFVFRFFFSSFVCTRFTISVRHLPSRTSSPLPPFLAPVRPSDPARSFYTSLNFIVCIKEPSPTVRRRRRAGTRISPTPPELSEKNNHGCGNYGSGSGNRCVRAGIRKTGRKKSRRKKIITKIPFRRFSRYLTRI